MEELELEYKKLLNIIEGSNLATWEWNIQTDNLTVNEQWANNIGYTLEELRPISNDTWVDHIHPDDLAKSDDLLHKHLIGETDHYECELRLKHKDGRWVWIRDRGKIMDRDDKGNPIRMFGVHWDITLEHEQALELERIFSINLDLLAILDTEGRFIKVNEAWSEILGKSTEEIEGQYTLQYIYKEDIKETLKCRKKLQRGEEINCFINRINTPDGGYRYLEWKVKPYEGRIYAAARDVTDRMKYERQIIDTSNRDPLTNVYNRRYVFKKAEELLESCIKSENRFSIAILDIDNFKKINDTHGHQAGDFVLKEFTKIINENLRTLDVLGRYGGEEFIIILNNVNKDQANLVVERILAIVRDKEFIFDEKTIKMTFSGGITDSEEIDRSELTLDALVKIADSRMYQAKNTGRNKIIFN